MLVICGDMTRMMCHINYRTDANGLAAEKIERVHALVSGWRDILFHSKYPSKTQSNTHSKHRRIKDELHRRVSNSKRFRVAGRSVLSRT